jgi:hypothetical protein
MFPLPKRTTMRVPLVVPFVLITTLAFTVEEAKIDGLKIAKVVALKKYEQGRIVRWEGRVPVFDDYPFYDITLSLGNRRYVVRYENVTGYYPSSWKVGNEIKVRLEGKGRMYLLNGAEEVPVGIFNNKAQQCVFVNSPPTTLTVGSQVPCT